VNTLGSGTCASVDGAHAECSFSRPSGIVVDEKTQSCFVTDFQGSKIRQISPIF
jgi:hypothetical protein